MAGGQERILRRRIRSVNATKKITRAMELISASRIVKAQARVHAAQPYADGITDVVRHLQEAGGGASSPLLTPRESIRRVAHVVIAADRGLAGAYNSSVLRAAEAEIRDHDAQGHDYALVTVGRKAEGYFRFRKYRIDDAFVGFTDDPSYEDARRVAGTVAPASRAVSWISSSSSTRGSSPPAGRKSSSARCCPSTARVSSLAVAKRPRRRTPVSRPRTTSSNRIPTPSSRPCCRGTRRRGCSPRCSTRPRRSTRLGSER